jgi:hypothetical protein
MTRALYASLLRLHPPAFRRQFGKEMLWIFDEACVSEGAFVLLFDLLISVARQWVVRPGLWKAALALTGAVLQVMVGGVGWVVFNPRIAANRPGAEMTPLLRELTLLTLWSVGIVFVGVFTSACWVTRFNRRRLAPRRRH